MYSPPYELQQKESELMCLLKQLLVVEDLSQQPSYTVPSCPFLHHRLSCLKTGGRPGRMQHLPRQLTFPNERQVGPHSGVSTK